MFRLSVRFRFVALYIWLRRHFQRTCKGAKGFQSTSKNLAWIVAVGGREEGGSLVFQIRQ